jgi:hypothetical protein
MTGKYVHYRFNEECEDTPQTVLCLVEEMLNQIKRLPRGQAYIRLAPHVERFKPFAGTKAQAVVRARISVLPEQTNEWDTMLLGFGLPRQMIEADL